MSKKKRKKKLAPDNADPKTDPGDEPGGKKAAVELVISLALAIGLAVAIKWMVFDVYSIPTGSMEPVLHGNASSGDRVFCFKQAYRFRDEPRPNRWEIFVFKFPATAASAQHAGENYIKRCVGLPGETIFIRRGDLWVRSNTQPIATLARKPLTAQKQLWIPVHREDFAEESFDALDHHWQRSGEASGWEVKDGSLSLRAIDTLSMTYRPQANGVPEAGIPDRHIKRQVVTFECPVKACPGRLRRTVSTQQLTATCATCGHFLAEADIVPSSFKRPGLNGSGETPRRDAIFHYVRDLRLGTTVTPETNGGELTLSLRDDQVLWRACVSLGTPGAATRIERVTLNSDGAPLGEPKVYPGKTVSLPTGVPAPIRFSRTDGRLRLEAGGQLLAEHEDDEALPRSIHAELRGSGASISLRKGTARLDDLTLDRDLHYFFIRYVSPGDWFANFVGKMGPNGPDRAGRLARRMNDEECYIIPDDAFLGFGDNSPTSYDGRKWGPVPRANLIGPAYFVWWPPHRARILE